jgi:hypothetical protein
MLRARPLGAARSRGRLKGGVARPPYRQREPDEYPVVTPEDLLTSHEAAKRLGVSAACFYQWLSQSDAGTLLIRGQPVTIDYLQGGPKGQGRIMIEPREIERLKDLMRVRPHPRRVRKPPTPAAPSYPGITVKLGLPPSEN